MAPSDMDLLLEHKKLQAAGSGTLVPEFRRFERKADGEEEAEKTETLDKAEEAAGEAPAGDAAPAPEVAEKPAPKAEGFLETLKQGFQQLTDSFKKLGAKAPKAEEPAEEPKAE